MELTATLYMHVALVLAVAAIIQGAAGFAFGLFATPMLLVAGLLPEQAVVLVSLCVMVQAALGLWSLRREVDWRKLRWLVPAAIAGQPLGVWVLGLVAELDPSQVRQVFGIILLVVLLVQWLLRFEPRETLHPGWGVFAMGSAGFSGALAAMPGPPVALWATAHRWPGTKVRVMMWAIILGMMPTNLLLLRFRFGAEVSGTLGLGLLFVPVVLIATLPGLWIGNRLGVAAVRKLATFLLLAIALYAILQPIILPQLG